jgi:competence protein ComEC
MYEPLPLLKSRKEWFYLLTLFFFIFSSNISFQYYKYSQLIQEEIYLSNALVINTYLNKNTQTLKLKNDNITFFTSNQSNLILKKQDYISLMLITTKASFFDYLKGLYLPSINIKKLAPLTKTSKDSLSKEISMQHELQSTQELFNALFLAIPLSKEYSNFFASYGISHLIAISGFHLGVLAFVIYYLLYLFYSPLHRKYFPYRNKKYDLMILATLLLFFYLLLIGLVASYLRAFLMYIFALFLLRNNLKIISFQTLLLVTLFIISLFPKLLFSLSLFFSLSGVFFIFLFIQYFSKLNKVFLFFFFNVWIYLALNPIIHFFFATTTIEQFYSPIITILFSLFYPIELFLHLISHGYILDEYIDLFMRQKVVVFDIYTPTLVFIYYIILSFLSIFYKKAFLVLNISFIIFNVYLCFIIF